MTGNGFHLKKLFGENIYINRLRAYIYTAIIVGGPAALFIMMITPLNFLFIFRDISLKQKELLLSAAVDSFALSLMITGGFSFIVSRYIWDKIYAKDYDDILPSFYGVTTICLLIGGVVGGIFYYLSPLSIYLKIFSYILFMEFIITWLALVYITFLKGHMIIIKSYLIGFIAALACVFLLLEFFGIECTLSCMAALTGGVLLIIILLVVNIKKLPTSKDKGYFTFLIYIGKYSSLFLTGVFLTAGFYVHIIIFRYTGPGGIFILCPFYELPWFYSLVNMVIVLMIYVVFAEKAFYKKYKTYYTVFESGTLDDIERARKEMGRELWDEVIYIMGFLLFFTLVFMAAGLRFLPGTGIAGSFLHIFNILVLGNYLWAILFIIVLLLLFFDDRKGALLISGGFLAYNVVFTMVTLQLGENFYGLGHLSSSFLSLVTGICRLSIILKNIDYYILCSQPGVYKEKRGFIEELVKKLELFLQH